MHQAITPSVPAGVCKSLLLSLIPTKKKSQKSLPKRPSRPCR